MNTIITEKTDDGEISHDVFSKLIESRILFVYGEITDDVAADTVAALLYLDHADDSKKISLYINSLGGDISNVFMIYDVMKMINSPIETLCVGSAEGEPILLVAAGTKGMRRATKNVIFNVCQTTPSLIGHVNMMQADIAHKYNKEKNTKFISCMAECTGKSVKKLMKDAEREFYLNASEAKKYGIIDSIVGGNIEKKKAK